MDDNEPSKDIICTAISFPILQLIWYTSASLLGIWEIIACKTNVMLSLDWVYVAEHYPVIKTTYSILGIICMICLLLSIFGLLPIHLILR